MPLQPIPSAKPNNSWQTLSGHLLPITNVEEPSKGDAEKVRLAARLRAETTMTVGWIAERLGMGTRGHLNHLLYLRRKSGGE